MKTKELLFTVLIAALLISSGMAVRENGYESGHIEPRQYKVETFTLRSGGYEVNVRAHTTSFNFGPSSSGVLVSSGLFFGTRTP